MLVSRGADVNAKDMNVSLGMGGCKGFLCFLLGFLISSCLCLYLFCLLVRVIGYRVICMEYLLLLFGGVIC